MFWIKAWVTEGTMLTQKMETHQIEIDSSRTRKDINIGTVQSNAQYMMTESPHFLSLLHCIRFIIFFILTSGYLICNGRTLI